MHENVVTLYLASISHSTFHNISCYFSRQFMQQLKEDMKIDYMLKWHYELLKFKNEELIQIGFYGFQITI